MRPTAAEPTPPWGKRVTIRLLTSVVFAALAVSACSQPEVPPDRFYRIDVAAPSPTNQKTAIAATLVVERPDAAGLADGRPIVYIDSARPNEMLEYNYHFWAEPPSIMLRDQLVDYLRTAGIANTVVTEDLRISADYAVTGKLKRLERIVGDSPKVVIEIELGLRDNRQSRLLHLSTYRGEAVPADDSVSTAIDAFNAAFTDVCALFASEIAAK